MPTIQHDHVEIAYLDEGAGDPVILVHGFASTKEVNWVRPGWVDALTRAGRRVVALDNRGHGASTKLHEPDAYRLELMADDVRALMDHLRIARADIMGYSMGSRIAAMLALRHPERVRSVILAGIGRGLVDGGIHGETVARALEAPTRADVTDRTGRTFRDFATHTASDLRALAACMRGSRQLIAREAIARLAAPVLIAVGTTDDIAGPARELAAMIPDAQVLDIPGRDHMRTVGDKVYKSGVLDFLSRRR
jgi:pimeloyl-ACP methyl ester carboxylesterase